MKRGTHSGGANEESEEPKQSCECEKHANYGIFDSGVRRKRREGTKKTGLPHPRDVDVESALRMQFIS